MGEAKRRKANSGSSVPSLSDERYADQWTSETGLKLAALCGSDVHFAEIGVLGLLIMTRGLAATDHAAMTDFLKKARRIRTAPHHWPKLMAAAAIAAQDSIFIASSKKLFDFLHTQEVEA